MPEVVKMAKVTAAVAVAMHASAHKAGRAGVRAVEIGGGGECRGG